MDLLALCLQEDILNGSHITSAHLLQGPRQAIKHFFSLELPQSYFLVRQIPIVVVCCPLFCSVEGQSHVSALACLHPSWP